MEVFKKVCRHCYKDFTTPRKQQRYCGQLCSYKGKKKMAFNNYFAEKAKHVAQMQTESMAIRRSRPDNELAGLCLDRECYSE